MDNKTARYGMAVISLKPTSKTDGVYDKKLTGNETYIYGYYVFTDGAVNDILNIIQKLCPMDDNVYTAFINGRPLISFINVNERLTIKNGEFEYEDR